MNRTPSTALLQLGTATICCLGLVAPLLAAPPASRTQTTGPAAIDGMFSLRGSAKNTVSVAQPATFQTRLDLRPPASEFGEVAKQAEPDSRREFGREQDIDHAASENSRATLNGGMAQAHPVGLAQGMAERFHREGLPVARLWETHSTLVSLGLNPKGKPGLWLVGKTH